MRGAWPASCDFGWGRNGSPVILPIPPRVVVRWPGCRKQARLGSGRKADRQLIHESAGALASFPFWHSLTWSGAISLRRSLIPLTGDHSVIPTPWGEHPGDIGLLDLHNHLRGGRSLAPTFWLREGSSSSVLEIRALPFVSVSRRWR